MDIDLSIRSNLVESAETEKFCDFAPMFIIKEQIVEFVFPKIRNYEMTEKKARNNRAHRKESLKQKRDF